MQRPFSFREANTAHNDPAHRISVAEYGSRQTRGTPDTSYRYLSYITAHIRIIIYRFHIRDFIFIIYIFSPSYFAHTYPEPNLTYTRRPATQKV